MRRDRHTHKNGQAIETILQAILSFVAWTQPHAYSKQFKLFDIFDRERVINYNSKYIQ